MKKLIWGMVFILCTASCYSYENVKKKCPRWCPEWEKDKLCCIYTPKK